MFCISNWFFYCVVSQILNFIAVDKFRMKKQKALEEKFAKLGKYFPY